MPPREVSIQRYESVADEADDAPGEPGHARMPGGGLRLAREHRLLALLLFGALAAAACLMSARGPAAQGALSRLRGMVEYEEEGSVCEGGRDYWWGLCYPGCSGLTEGEFPHRGSGCKCCKDAGLCNDPERYSYSCENYSNSPSEPIGYPTLTVPGDCNDGEELFGAICYTKCSVAFPEYPYRIGACQCCNSPSATCSKTPENYVTNCSVLAVGLNNASGLHPPDAVCDEAEDFIGGLCYDRCSILSDGELPIRRGACTCCAEWPCEDTLTYVTDCDRFNQGVGGEAPHLPPFIGELAGGGGIYS